ncbi:MAG: B12-binding domain-containing radical SAM protein [Candidatus Scalindua sp.]|nr:B12-binding domain-containing radical SAM protein [Candidatus Scalindua sp.]
MKVLFINNVLGSDCIGRVPLGVLYISAALRKAGHETDIVDTRHFKNIIKKIEDYNPAVLLFSLRTASSQIYINLNRRIKSDYPEMVSIFGGPHATFYPQIIEGEKTIDAVCVGEGEDAITEYINRLENGDEYHTTPNFWTRRNGAVYKNSVRPLIGNIDNVSYPDRELLCRYPSVRDFPVRNFITTRGCPYSCTYCFNQAYNEIYKGLGKRVRRRSVDNVITEIEEEYQRNPFQLVQFEDDIFVVPGKWLEDFSEKYRSKIGLPFTCNVRAELITEKEVSLIRNAGCVSVWIGVESGSEVVRKNLLKRNNTDSTTINCVKLLQSAGIYVATENILGLPETTLDDDFKTFELNCVLRPGFANPSIYQPYPGTELGRRASDAGIFSGNFDDIKNFYSTSSLNIKHRREVENLQCLFSFCVEFPFLSSFLRKLVHLPLNSLYRGMQTLWRGYALTQRIIPVKLGIRQWLHVVRRSLGI